MPEGNQKKICEACSSKDAKIETLTSSNDSLSKQVKDLVVKKDSMIKNLDEIKREKTTLSKTLSERELKDYYRSVQGKEGRINDFVKLIGDADYKNWDELETRKFKANYPFLFEDTPTSPNSINKQATNDESGIAPKDETGKIGVEWSGLRVTDN